MLELLKYIPAAMAGRDVVKEVKRVKGEDADKPFYLRQRFWGLTGVAGTVAGSAAFGYQIDTAAVNELMNSLNQVLIALSQIIEIVKKNWYLVPAIYESGVLLKGQYDAQMRARKEKDAQKTNGSV